ncbi:ATP-grasp domain-containing protein [Peptostreptococcus equinus]|uniref:ATP-grasp domain-containing protein n=1 Tax=Peptostreptococcus equinus TaxID=3003601 RepID=A0ABY7JLC9_9FIRM|nr:ATP-grasp domain-containing protein [Peptostreptococcus sp. CBA3647]WAW14158.1 ATP-grasp domain-containing protein [Peptostreptococcus sp. CBA3647]
MKKKLMILGASILQLPAIINAIELGLDTIVVDMNPQAIGFKIEGIKKEIISTNDIPAILMAAKKHKIDGIMTLATDLPMRSVAKVTKELNLIGIDENTALKATNKYEMRNALKKHGVPIPIFYKVSTEQEYIDVVKNMTLPFIVKPVDSSGSRGIFKISSFENIDELKYAYEYSKKYSHVGDVMVEEYMEGFEVSVETLSVDGVCNVIQITDKLTTGAPHFVEIGHSQPTKLSKKIAQDIANVAIKANKAIGIKNGPSHTEIIVTEDGPKIVELGARLGGDNIATHLVPLSTGINIVESCIKIAIGEKPDITSKFYKASAIRYFNQKAGKIKNIEGIETAKNIAGIKQINLVYNIGEEITEINSSSSRMGFVISQNENIDMAINNCIEAIDKIKITIE